MPGLFAIFGYRSPKRSADQTLGRHADQRVVLATFAQQFGD